jgi:AcrR family transcriptional regulator
MTTETPTPARRGRPRSAASEQAILLAALDLMAEGQGPAALSIAAIARRAGAGKDTIYRRWQSKEDLLLDALTAQIGELEIPAEMSLREALVKVLSELIRRLQDERARKIMRSLQGAGEDFPKLRERYYAEVVRRRHQIVEAHVRTAVKRGEVPDSAGLRDAAEMLFHHVLMRALEDDPVTGDPVQAATALVDIVMDGILAPTAG